MADGILFDIDGTLILSNEAHARAWAEVCAERGRPVPFERIVKLMGMGGDLLVPKLFPDLDSSAGLGKELKEAHERRYMENYVSGVTAAPGAQDLIRLLRKQGLRVLAATSSCRAELEGALAAAGLAEVPMAAVTGDEAEQPKPAPDVVALGLARLDLPPSRVVMVGDSPYDIRAAGRVGVRVVAVRCGGYTDEELAGAVAIYDDPAELAQQLGGSPLLQ